MNADDVLHDLEDAAPAPTPGALVAGLPQVIAVHDAVVVDVGCPDHGPHSIIACGECDTVDGRTLDDEDCELVRPVLGVLLGDHR